ncbi:MAG: hypothetical protein Fur0046_27590 [Cyanobacteria bacterium J069]|nr:MAG: hypothetical protein D6742_11560 [Cyanobacteria bacterium J069]
MLEFEPLLEAESQSEDFVESFDYEPDLALNELIQTLGIDPSMLSRLTQALSGSAPATGAPSAARRVANGDRPQWYLGLDLGTTGISAVLLSYPAAVVHPIYWLELPAAADRGQQPARKTFRLPTSVQLNADSETANGAAPIAIAPLSSPAAQTRPQQPHRLVLQHLKPYLRAGVPHYSTATLQWEPVAQWSDRQTLPLSLFQQALRTLLVSLVLPPADYATDNAANTTPLLTCGAVDLEESQFQAVLRQLAGVIVSYPSNWSDTYSFNLREAILSARLVGRPDQIFLLEEAIATLLSGLSPADDRPLRLLPTPAQPADLYSNRWQGGTLVLNAGATLSELALVSIPSQLQHLSHCDVTSRTLPYAGTAIDQDILIQLVYPAWVRQTHGPQGSGEQSGQTGDDRPLLSASAAAHPVPASAAAHPGDTWADLTISPEESADPWLAVGWDSLTLPAAGEPDPPNRHRLLQRLRSSDLGLWLLHTAEQLKIVLQQQDQVSLTLGNQTLSLTRQDLSSRVLLPYIERLNRELNALLRQTGLSRLEIRQVVCAGGSASLVAIARWLHQKLPNATIIQDTYLSATHAATACSRVAYGLAALPLHPHLLNQPRHQTSDYFLLMELLRTFPEHPVTLDSVMQVLERRGIDTQSCRQHIFALLEGHLPPGLVPTADSALLSPASCSQPDYAQLLAAPLFFKQDAATYRPNLPQWQRLRAYLDTLLSTTHQKLTEPQQSSLGSLSTQPSPEQLR